MESQLISVIIPAYNHEKYVGEAIESVLKQSYQKFELIIINDGSKDRTDEVIREFIDKRIIYHSQNNAGAHNAINKGIQISNGEYITILNSDDVYHPDKLKRCIQEIEGNPAIGMICSQIEFIDKNGMSLPSTHPTYTWHKKAYKFFEDNTDLILSLFNSNFIMTSSNIFCRAEVANKCGLFKGLRYAHDLEFVVNAGARSQIQILKEPLIKYRVHETNTISENQSKVRLEVAWIFSEFVYDNANNALFDKLDNYINVAKSVLILEYSFVLLGYRTYLDKHFNQAEAQSKFNDIIENENNVLRKKLLERIRKE